MPWIDVAVGQLIQPRFALDLCANGIYWKEDSPSQKPGWDEDLEHHPEKADKNVCIWCSVRQGGSAL